MKIKAIEFHDEGSLKTKSENMNFGQCRSAIFVRRVVEAYPEHVFFIDEPSFL